MVELRIPRARHETAAGRNFISFRMLIPVGTQAEVETMLPERGPPSLSATDRQIGGASARLIAAATFIPVGQVPFLISSAGALTAGRGWIQAG